MEFVSGGDSLYAQVLEPAAGAQASGAPTQTLVLLHPTPLDHTFWLPVAERLPDFRRVLPDLRGHGRSPLGLAPSRVDPTGPVLTVEQLAADTIALLDALGIEQAVFAGCSIGGYTLYELWRTAPERISGLAFCAGKPQSDTAAERAKREHWIAKHEPARVSGADAPIPEFVDAMLTALLSRTTRHERAELVVQARAMMAQIEPGALQAIQRGLGVRPDARATAETVTVPTCVIAGAEDASSTPFDLLALHIMLRRSGAPGSYHLLADAGHYGPLEQPDETAGILEAFCRSIPFSEA